MILLWNFGLSHDYFALFVIQRSKVGEPFATLILPKCMLIVQKSLYMRYVVAKQRNQAFWKFAHGVNQICDLIEILDPLSLGPATMAIEHGVANKRFVCTCSLR